MKWTLDRKTSAMEGQTAFPFTGGEMPPANAPDSIKPLLKVPYRDLGGDFILLDVMLASDNDPREP
ncbi:hypothetical protein [Natrinema sp. 1APR25-10V2]|uniref:hypothetical protein n=1 Tax=Natrinema sp. 1APR25-10V2 TaxID=2951081 RepID=UPI00287B9173|nr:hypothetical protein [Natrinema sp. 1APR25-10V2]